jgi:hypothetical protein
MSVAPGELVGLPDGGPATLAGVKEHLSIGDDRDDTRLTSIVAAVNSQVRSWPVAVAAVDAETWPARIVEGANMLAARLFRRKNSPAGVESFGDQGATYVMRNDPDIAMLLKMGTYTPPQIG